MRRMYPGQIVTMMFVDVQMQLLFTEDRKYRWLMSDIENCLEIHKNNLAHLLDEIPESEIKVECVTRNGVTERYKTISRDGLIAFLEDFRCECPKFQELYDWIFEVANTRIKKTDFDNVIGTRHALQNHGGLTMTKAAGEIGCSFTQLRHYLWQNGWISRINDAGQVTDKWVAVKEYIDNGFLTTTVTHLPVITHAGIEYLKAKIDELLSIEASSQIKCVVPESSIIKRWSCLVGDSFIRTIFTIAGHAWYSVQDIATAINPAVKMDEVLNKYCSTILESPFGEDSKVVFVKHEVVLKMIEDLSVFEEQAKEMVEFIEEINECVASKKDIKVIGANNEEVVIPLIIIDIYDAVGFEVKVTPANMLHEFLGIKSSASTWLKNEIETMKLTDGFDYFSIMGDKEPSNIMININIAIGMAYAAKACEQVKYLAMKA